MAASNDCDLSWNSEEEWRSECTETQDTGMFFYVIFFSLLMLSCDLVQLILNSNPKWVSALYSDDSFLSRAASRHFQAHAANTHKEHANL